MSSANTYYYEQLSKEHRQVYHAMKAGLLALAPSFTVPRLPTKTLYDIYFMLRMDCPEIFYSTSFTCRCYPNAENLELVPEYLFKKKQIQEHQRAMTARIQKLIRPAQQLSETDKERYVHDFICQNVRYDKLKKAYSHEIIGPLGQGVGVCEGIAKTVKILCDHLGVWCIVALSGNNPDKGIKYRHTWNVVKLGGGYYHLDATFDNSLGNDGLIRYDYFNLSDSHLFRDHEPVIWPVPACGDGSRFYYREQKLSFTKQEDVGKRVAQAAKKNRTLVFQWRGGYLTREVLDELLRLIDQEAASKGKRPRIALNWPQAVLQVSFQTEPPGETVVMQQANEGEQIDIE